MKVKAIVQIPFKVGCTFEYDPDCGISIVDVAKKIATNSYLSLDLENEFNLENKEPLFYTKSGNVKIWKAE